MSASQSARSGHHPSPAGPAAARTLARRAERLEPSVIRELLKLAERPGVVSLAGDDEGPHPDALRGAAAAGARFAYLTPTFQNPTGRCIGGARRGALAAACMDSGLPLLGSLSKVLAPGLRLGYLVAPPTLYPKLLQAKQAADLHTPGFNQRIAMEVLRDDGLARHLPTVRERYRAQRDAMHAALGRVLRDALDALDPAPPAAPDGLAHRAGSPADAAGTPETVR